MKRLLREVIAEGTGKQLSKLPFTVLGKQEQHKITEMLGF